MRIKPQNLNQCGRICDKKCQIVINNGSYATTVRPVMLPTSLLNNPQIKNVFETANGKWIPILRIHEAWFHIGQRTRVFAAQIFIKLFLEWTF